MPNREERFVFIDESGDPNLPQTSPGASEYYVLTAVLVKVSELSEANRLSAELIQRYFQDGEMKSSSVGGNTNRRAAILSAIGELPIKHYTQVIDKSEILTESGLRFRKSFVKFIQRSIYQKLFSSFPSLHVYTDEHGSSTFMDEFGSYIQNRLPRSLFENSTFDFADSTEFPLIQISDMIAGSIARTYRGLDENSILNPIRDQILIIDEWPPKSPIPLSSADVSAASRFDLMISQQAVEHAGVFIEGNTNNRDDIVQAQVAAVRYLLYHFRSIDPEEYIPTKQLYLHLSQLGQEYSERKIRSQVIGKLRDKSVFIVSSNKGIKIPYSAKELIQFSEMVSSKSVPYMNRLEIIRKHFLVVSDGEFDMVPIVRFPELNRILERGV